MSCTLVIEHGNSAVLQATVRNALTGEYVANAVVTARVLNAARQEVAGIAWPVPLIYISGSNGVYRALLPASIELFPGLPYTAEITIEEPGASAVRVLEMRIVVVNRGCGEQVPHSSPASPAYQGPSTLQKLHEAEAALHRLILGRSPRVIVDQNGERVEYTAANRGALQQYVNSLKQQLGLLTTSATRPAGVYF